MGRGEEILYRVAGAGTKAGTIFFHLHVLHVVLRASCEMHLPEYSRSAHHEPFPVSLVGKEAAVWPTFLRDKKDKKGLRVVKIMQDPGKNG